MCYIWAKESKYLEIFCNWTMKSQYSWPSIPSWPSFTRYSQVKTNIDFLK